MNIEILLNLKKELKEKEDWKNYKDLKKIINKLELINSKEEETTPKRITIFSRFTTIRGKGGYFQKVEEIEEYENLTDKKLSKKLEELNKNKRTNFYSIKYDFKLSTKKGLKDYKHYLVDIGRI
jgi:hypothetical protein